MIGYFHFRFKDASLVARAPAGKEYVFNARPQHQLEVTQERLIDWYKLVFGKAKNRSIVDKLKYSITDRKTGEVSFSFSSQLCCHYDLFLRDPS